MKQVVLAVMAVIIATSAGAVSPGMDFDGGRDFSTFESEVITPIEIEVPEIVYDWDYFWGTEVPAAFDPQTSGWNDFWYTCQSIGEIKTLLSARPAMCVATIFTGMLMAIAAPVAITLLATEGPSMATIAAAIGVGAA